MTQRLSKITQRQVFEQSKLQKGDSMFWVQNIRDREHQHYKIKKLVGQQNKMIYNFGVLSDFFSYSAFSIQDSKKQIDVKALQTQSIIGEKLLLDPATAGQNSTIELANVFAIAKVGLPNLIFPNSLDIKISNYQNFQAYMAICDRFFPELSKSQHTVVILRPLIVKNGLNELFIQILKANDFIILKRKTRMLLKPEISYMAKVEKITPLNSQFYYNSMMSGEAEILVLTKISGIQDAISLFQGSNPLGRRRVPQTNEDTTNIRSNVDSVNAMFEVNPFSSFNELLDLEDFVIDKANLKKYITVDKQVRKPGEKSQPMTRVDQELYFNKVQEIRQSLNKFVRFFNVAGFSSPNEYEAHRQMCILMPEIGTIEEVAIILNPLYNNYIDPCFILLKRMGFEILEHKFRYVKQEDAESLFADYQFSDTKFMEADDDRIIKLLADHQVHFFHLAKIAGDREIRQTFKASQFEYEDTFTQKIKNIPFKPMHFPYLFLFMDTPLMYEEALKCLYPERLVSFTGQDTVDTFTNKEKLQSLNQILIANVGDKVKEISFDRRGNLVKIEPLDSQDPDNLTVQNALRQPQYQLLYSNPKLSNSVHFAAESQSHGIFEVRFHRLPQRQAEEKMMSGRVNELSFGLDEYKVKMFTKFQSLNYYYNEVNKYFYNVCPAFYRFKIYPLTISQQYYEHLHKVPQQKKEEIDEVEEKINDSPMLHRVYEIEEYMGKSFIEEIADMQQDHCKMIKHQRMSNWKYMSEQEQQSLPAYVWGLRLSQMCKQLESIKGYFKEGEKKPNQVNFQDQSTMYIKGAGKILYKNGKLVGEVEKITDYFEYDKNRFMNYLQDFKKGWHYYLSVLETDIIEQKLLHLLHSFTFKYSRLPQMMSLIPDRVEELNLRISEKIKVLNQQGLNRENKEKFFNELKETLIDPHREENAHNVVSSMMYTINLEAKRKQADQKLKEKGTTLEEIEKQLQVNEEFSINKDCSIVGIDLARRPKYQLFASVLYLVNFFQRKIERRTDLFIESDKRVDHELSQEEEDDYDNVLDILVRSLTENYGNTKGVTKNEYNYALDVIQLSKGYESQFEKMMREKNEKEQRLKARLQQRLEDEQRKMRTVMSYEELIQTQCQVPRMEYERKQRVLLKKFVETRGHLDKNGDEFQQVLSETQSMLGVYSLKLARDYANKFTQKTPVQQEKISFVKMEYFLYGISEAHLIITELKIMEDRNNQLQDEFDILQKGGQNVERRLSQNSLNMGSRKRSDTPFSKKQEKQEILTAMERQLEKMRYQISMKETELVFIFRELMNWDYFVPDYLFDAQLLKEQTKNQQEQEQYLLPLKTFWKSVVFDDPYENDLYNDKYYVRLRDYTLDAPETLLPISLVRQPYSKLEQTWQQQHGLIVSNLRPHDYVKPTEEVRFNKFFSKGEINEVAFLNQEKDIIKQKTQKTHYYNQNPF